MLALILYKIFVSINKKLGRPCKSLFLANRLQMKCPFVKHLSALQKFKMQSPYFLASTCLVIYSKLLKIFLLILLL